MRAARKAVSIFMSVVLAVGLMPLPAFAGDGSFVSTQGVSLPSANGDDPSGTDGDSDTDDGDYPDPNDDEAPDDTEGTDDTDDAGDDPEGSDTDSDDSNDGTDSDGSGDDTDDGNSEDGDDSEGDDSSEGEVTAIAFEPVTPLVVEEGESGYWDYVDGSGWVFYNALPSFRDGDKLTVTTAAGETVYTFALYDEDVDADGYGEFVADGQEPILDWEVRDNSRIGTTVGMGDKTCYLSYGDKECEVSLTVTSSPVTSISFTPVEEIKLTEGVDGWDTGGDDHPYFKFSTPGFSEGDTLTVVDSNGSTAYSYYGEYDEDEGEYVCAFKSADGSVIDASGVSWISSQDEAWAAGSSQSMAVSYRGRVCDVPVTIVENNVKEISFSPKEGYLYYEGVNGWPIEEGDESGSYYHYYIPEGFEAGDELTVTYKDGSQKGFVYTARGEDEEDAFVAEDGSLLEEPNPRTVDDQDANPWTLGSDNYFIVEYRGAECKVPVTVAANPVAEISYHPASTYEIEEDTDVVVRGRNKEDGGYEFYHYYDFQVFRANDKLVVKGTDGTSKTYVYHLPEADDEDSDGQFVEEGGSDVLEGVGYESDQGESTWEAGHTYSATVSYMGRECKVPISIIANPVKSIEFKPANPYRIVEDTNGWMEYDVSEGQEPYYRYETPSLEVNDQLTIKWTDGTETVYTCQWDEGEEQFVSVNGSVVISGYDVKRYLDQDPGETWEPGTYQMSVYYRGRTCFVDVEIVPNPVASIEFTPSGEKYELIEEIDGYWDEDADDEPFFYYRMPGFEIGDVLKVIDSDGNAVEYTYGYIDNGEGDSEYTAFSSESGDVIEEDDVRFESDQWDDHWGAGDHTITATYMGRSCDVGVTVLSNETASIAFEPNQTPQIIKEDPDYCYWDSVDQCYYYDLPWFSVGDKLTVRMSDESEETYTFSYDEEDGGEVFLSADGTKTIDPHEDISRLAVQSSSNPWDEGTHEVTLTYRGRSCNYNVEILPKLDFTKATVELSQSAFTYTGSACIPAVTVTLDGETLYKDVHYSLSYSNNVNAGTATVTVTGIGKYEGSVDESYTISRASISAATISGIAAKTYNGSAQTQSPVVRVGTRTLRVGVDYTLSYSNNVNAGTAAVTVAGKGNYVGTASRGFAISPASQTVKAAKASYTVKAKAAKKKAQKLAVKFAASGGGKVTYAAAKSGKVSIAKNGKVTVKKGTKKGTYKLKVTCTAAAAGNYAQTVVKNVVLVVKVK